MTILFQEVKDDLMTVNILADTNIPPPLKLWESYKSDVLEK